VDPQPVELEFHDLEKMPMQTLDERNHIEIMVR
jgi:hypothetical protein